MTRSTYCFLRACLTLAFSTFATLVNAGTVDLSNGIVFPSNNSAPFENAAVLGNYKDQMVEAAVFPPDHGELGTGTISLVGRSGWFGYGVGLWKPQIDDNTVSGAMGIHLADSVQLGLTANYSVDHGTTTLDAGGRFTVGEQLNLAVALYGIERGWPSHWSIGFAPQLSSRTVFEADFRAVSMHYQSFEPAQAEVLLGMSLKIGESMTARFGTIIVVYPEINFPADRIELGFSAWLGERVAIFGTYRDHRGPEYTVGFKFK